MSPQPKTANVISFGRHKLGRKPASESRAAELCAKVAAWKQTPESLRPSLRALARDLGTSHQLLSHYLMQWDSWQTKEYRREAEEILARAESENRPMTPWEEQRVQICNTQALAWAFSAELNRTYRKLRCQAKRGQLAAGEVKMLKYFARRGEHKAQEILDAVVGGESSEGKSKNNLPEARIGVAKSFRFD